MSETNSNNRFSNRKSIRHKYFDYNDGVVFITICTQNRRNLLSQIVGNGDPDGPRVELTEFGIIVDKYIAQLNKFYENISVEKYVIMPNHIHLLLFVRPTDRRGRRSLQHSEHISPVYGSNCSKSAENCLQNSHVSKFISTLKRFCNKDYGGNIWQRGSHDHIIRNDRDLDEHIRYILENPLNWQLDELYSEE